MGLVLWWWVLSLIMVIKVLKLKSFSLKAKRRGLTDSTLAFGHGCCGFKSRYWQNRIRNLDIVLTSCSMRFKYLERIQQKEYQLCLKNISFVITSEY